MEEKARQERQNKRRRQILAATLRLLRRHGTGISTAQIAAEAHCSKETLYNWFDDREGIFRVLAEEQAIAMGDALRKYLSRAEGLPFKAKLTAYCVALLDVMTGEAVVAVNRVAMAEACRDQADMGLTVLDDWQARVVAPFCHLLDQGRADGECAFDDVDDAFEALMGLLVGDRQRRLLLGEEARPDSTTMANAAETAVARWLKIFGS